jgi:hypothetical protein
VEFTSLACFLALVVNITGVSGHPEARRFTPRRKSISTPCRRIRDEELKHSQVMETVGDLTDVVCARLTGSPNLKKGSAICDGQNGEWGITNPHSEAWLRDQKLPRKLTSWR